MIFRLVATLTTALWLCPRIVANQMVSGVRDEPRRTTSIAQVGPGRSHEICTLIPDSANGMLGPNIYRHSHRVVVTVFGKIGSQQSWGEPCRATARDFTKCGEPSNSGFRGTNFEIEAAGPNEQRVCWTFVNRSKQLMDAKVVVDYMLYESDTPTFSLGPLPGPNDERPLVTSTTATCLCSLSDSTLVAYFGGMLGPSREFFAKRGDVIEIKALGLGNQDGLPDDCKKGRELTSGIYRIRIKHIHLFQQPAIYKTYIVGEVTSDALTDERVIFQRR